MFYRTFINGLSFNGYFKDAIEVALDTFDTGVILGSEVYSNLLKNSAKNVTSNQPNLISNLSPDETSILADELRQKLAQVNILVDNSKAKWGGGSKNSNYRRRKSEDPLPYHKSNQQNSPQVFQRKRNNSGYDPKVFEENMMRKSVFGNK